MRFRWGKNEIFANEPSAYDEGEIMPKRGTLNKRDEEESVFLHISDSYGLISQVFSL